MSHLSLARQMSSLGGEHKNARVGGTWTQVMGGMVAATGVPGDEERGVVVGGMAVVLDVLALLPDAEVVERGGGVEAHRRPFLFTHIGNVGGFPVAIRAQLHTEN